MNFLNDLTILASHFKDNQLHFEKLIKTMLLPVLHSAAGRAKQPIKKLLNWLVELKQITATPKTAYTFLRTLTEQKVFPSALLEYLDGAEAITRDIEGSGVVDRWKGFEVMWSKSRNRGVELLCLLQALNIFLSGHFIEGVLAERL